MKIQIVITSLILSLLTACGSSQINQSQLNRDAIEDMVKEDKIIGEDLPSWVEKSGMESGNVYVVGSAEFSADKSPLYVEKAATMDAEVRLLTDAPADFRIVTQNALNGAGIESAEFYQIQTKVQEVVGLTGIKINTEKVTCRKILRYGNMSTNLNRICYVQAFVSVSELMKAYQRTLEMKFGKKVSEAFHQKMDQELERVNSQSVMKKAEPVVQKQEVPVI